ncbi:hypothetical protein Dimus_034589 [Dionaea muscipula]
MAKRGRPRRVQVNEGRKSSGGGSTLKEVTIPPPEMPVGEGFAPRAKELGFSEIDTQVNSLMEIEVVEDQGLPQAQAKPYLNAMHKGIPQEQAQGNQNRIDKARAIVEETREAMRISIRAEFESHSSLDLPRSRDPRYVRRTDVVKQRSKDDWFKLYDRNTKYFYSIMRGKARKNFILRLIREDGTWASTKEEIGDEVFQFY